MQDRPNPGLARACDVDWVAESMASGQSIVSKSTLLFPPLLQPKFAEFPLGVSTLTFTDSGLEMMPVVSITFSCVALTTVVLSAVPLISTSEAETN